MREQSFDDFEQWNASRHTWRHKLLAAWPYALGLVLAALLAWFIYLQLTSMRGVKVEAPSPTAIDMLPPPPPPPPPPPEPEPEPPEPTEQPEPVPNPETPKAAEPEPAPAAAPVTIAGDVQPGADSYGIAAGSGGGIGKPGGAGTCLGTNCGARVGGGGMSDSVYRRYLSSVLQERVQSDEKANRLVFSADFAITVTPAGRLTSARLIRSTGQDERDRLLREILERVAGLTPPPDSMRFPQRVTVRGRRAS